MRAALRDVRRFLLRRLRARLRRWALEPREARRWGGPLMRTTILLDDGEPVLSLPWASRDEPPEGDGPGTVHGMYVSTPSGLMSPAADVTFTTPAGAPGGARSMNVTVPREDWERPAPAVEPPPVSPRRGDGTVRAGEHQRVLDGVCLACGAESADPEVVAGVPCA